MKALLIVASVFIVAAGAMLVIAPTRPVLLSISPDPGMVRPRNYCVMNPFRDRSPERAAERYLVELRQGRAESIAALVSRDDHDHVIESEMKWPIASWRIARRKDTAAGSELVYWVRRGNGYSDRGGEEEVHFQVAGFAGRAHVIGFGVIY
jgi:hypothetical protein